MDLSCISYGTCLIVKVPDIKIGLKSFTHLYTSTANSHIRSKNSVLNPEVSNKTGSLDMKSLHKYLNARSWIFSILLMLFLLQKCQTSGQ